MSLSLLAHAMLTLLAELKCFQDFYWKTTYNLNFRKEVPCGSWNIAYIRTK